MGTRVDPGDGATTTGATETGEEREGFHRAALSRERTSLHLRTLCCVHLRRLDWPLRSPIGVSRGQGQPSQTSRSVGAASVTHRLLEDGNMETKIFSFILLGSLATGGLSHAAGLSKTTSQTGMGAAEAELARRLDAEKGIRDLLAPAKLPASAMHAHKLAANTYAVKSPAIFDTVMAATIKVKAMKTGGYKAYTGSQWKALY